MFRPWTDLGPWLPTTIAIPEPELIVEVAKVIAAPMALELGLRWLHDRADEEFWKRAMREHTGITIPEILRQLDARGFPPDEVNMIVNMIADEATDDAVVGVAAPLALELGLRWLHDRIDDDRYESIMRDMRVIR